MSYTYEETIEKTYFNEAYNETIEISIKSLGAIKNGYILWEDNSDDAQYNYFITYPWIEDDVNPRDYLFCGADSENEALEMFSYLYDGTYLDEYNS